MDAHGLVDTARELPVSSAWALPSLPVCSARAHILPGAAWPISAGRGGACSSPTPLPTGLEPYSHVRDQFSRIYGARLPAGFCLAGHIDVAPNEPGRGAMRQTSRAASEPDEPGPCAEAAMDEAFNFKMRTMLSLNRAPPSVRQHRAGHGLLRGSRCKRARLQMAAGHPASAAR